MDAEPVIILQCGHFATLESMDGSMELHKAYSSDLKSLVAISGELLQGKVCSECRAPINGVRRYGRIIKKAAVDQHEKTFMSLVGPQISALNQKVTSITDSTSMKDVDGLVKEALQLCDIIRLSPRRRLYEGSVAFLSKKGLQDHLHAPKPYYQFARESYALTVHLYLAKNRIKYREGLAASVTAAQTNFDKAILLILERLNAFMLKTTETVVTNSALSLQLLALEVRSESLARFSHPRPQILTLDQDFRSFYRILPPSFHKKFEDRLTQFERVLMDILDAKTNAEVLKMVVDAMKNEFSGSGHYYTCQNGHIYTIGECGMSMEISRCIECGVPVGGTNHNLLPGQSRSQADLL